MMRMTVTMDGSAGRRYGGRSYFEHPREYPTLTDAVTDLRKTYGCIVNQPDDDYLKDLARAGIRTTFEVL